MLRIAASRVLRRQPFQHRPQGSISNWKLPAFEIDPAGISGFFDLRNEAYLSLAQKMAEVRPMSLYGGLDEWSRELLVTLSTDLGCGFATSIILVTIAVKTLFMQYPTLRAQLQGLRQVELKQLSDGYREKMKTAQMTISKHLMTQASYKYKMAMKKRGINNVIPMLNLLQIPLLLTWFFSLRYMSNLPEMYHQMLTEGYLWFADLSTYDPYFVLPVVAACTTSISIARSPNLARNNLTMPMLAPYAKYIKYLPFASLAFTAFFPASINLYWFTLSGYQLMTTQMMYIKTIRRLFSGEKQDNRKKLEFDAAVFVEEKGTSEDVMRRAESKTQEERDLLRQRNIEINEVKVSLNKPKKKRQDRKD